MDRVFLGYAHQEAMSFTVALSGERKTVLPAAEAILVATANALILTFAAPAVNRAGLYFRHSSDLWT